MNQIDRNKILKMLAILLLLLAAVGVATHFHQKNSMTLDEYARLRQSSQASGEDPSGDGLSAGSGPENRADGKDSSLTDGADNVTNTGNSATDKTDAGDSTTDGPPDSTDVVSYPSGLTGALLNGGADGKAMIAERVTYAPTPGTLAEAFYYEPLSENLQRYITGISYPNGIRDSAGANDTGANIAGANIAPEVSYEDLRYVHILHYDFDGNSAEGELICNKAIAGDLLDIFYELYRNEYQLEKVRLIDEYDGDDNASMADNNTSCFNYRPVEGTDRLSRHALGMALDINPFYNPYVTYEKGGGMNVSPEGAEQYADRSMEFPYKIDEDDLCYKLFTQHGFTWGGNWNSSKDYQHFQKTQ
ncbi:MAG: M15 family metallopeptidase [Clostridium sp.]|nr:M15 family metallopeptidase [Acetatifactor muris]MCM1526468.1 M15 family metallopeptidase [Bacteroides sp.]MCM1564334.1 M15 family metallopeptidase [Clostridium sp.]